MPRYLHSLPALTEEEIKVLLLRVNKKDCGGTLYKKIECAIKLDQKIGDKPTDE